VVAVAMEADSAVLAVAGRAAAGQAFSVGAYRDLGNDTVQPRRLSAM
jgi:hypothetical protein